MKIGLVPKVLIPVVLAAVFLSGCASSTSFVGRQSLITNTELSYWQWSPTAKQLAFEDPNNTLFIINEDGSDEKKLADVSNVQNSPSWPNWFWSIDGKNIVYKGQDRDLYIIDNEGETEPVRLAADIKLLGGWTTNLEDKDPKIVYQDLNSNLFIVNPDGSGRLEIADDVAFWRWSREGNRVAYENALNGELNVVNLNGTDRQFITFLRDGIDFWRWSPQEDMLAFEGADLTLNVIRIDGTQKVELAALADDAIDDRRWSDWAWSPNGNKIGYRNPEGDLYVINPDGSSPFKLEDDIDAWDWFWSHDGEKVAFKHKDGSLYDINVDGTDRRKLASDLKDWDASLPVIYWDWSWSYDTSHILFETKDGELWITKAGGGTPEKLLDDVDLWNWAPNSNKIAFSNSKGLHVFS